MFNRDKLPGNIKFRYQNFLQPFPEELLGKYDLVHVRVMVLALSSDEWEPAVRNLMTLLREYYHILRLILTYFCSWLIIRTSQVLVVISSGLTVQHTTA